MHITILYLALRCNFISFWGRVIVEIPWLLLVVWVYFIERINNLPANLSTFISFIGRGFFPPLLDGQWFTRESGMYSPSNKPVQNRISRVYSLSILINQQGYCSSIQRLKMRWVIHKSSHPHPRWLGESKARSGNLDPRRAGLFDRSSKTFYFLFQYPKHRKSCRCVFFCYFTLHMPYLLVFSAYFSSVHEFFQ